MRDSKLRIAITGAILAITAGTYSAFAHEGNGSGMMSSNGMHGMGSMMEMMTDMSPEDRKAMTEACMKMMQNHGNDHMDGDPNNEDAEAN